MSEQSMRQHKDTVDGQQVGQCPIGEHQKRDATHVAIYPAYSRYELKPGERVDIVNRTDGWVCKAFSDEPLGIVDPFLTETVKPGQRFWVFLMPGSITTLKHVWEHPNVPEESNDDYVAFDECRACN